MTANPVTLNAITAVAGAIIALAFQLIPGLTPWFEKRTSQAKSLIMLAALALATGLIVLASCFIPTLPAVIACTDVGVTEVLVAFLFAVIGSQGTHAIAKNAMPTTGTPGSPPAP